MQYKVLNNWLGREESNLRMAESKSAALPLGDAPMAPRRLGRVEGQTVIRPTAGGERAPAKSCGRLLAQIGTTCQKPLHRAIERDESLVRQWLKKEYPKIKAMAKKQGADIYFGDAAHIRSDHHAGRTWGAKGDTPIVQATGARHGMS